MAKYILPTLSFGILDPSRSSGFFARHWRFVMVVPSATPSIRLD